VMPMTASVFCMMMMFVIRGCDVSEEKTLKEQLKDLGYTREIDKNGSYDVWNLIGYMKVDYNLHRISGQLIAATKHSPQLEENMLGWSKLLLSIWESISCEVYRYASERFEEKLAEFTHRR